MTDTVNTRRLALDVLLEVTEHGAYSNQVLRAVLEKYQYMEKYERAFLTRLVEGTIQHMIELDYVIDQFSKVKVKKMKPVIRNILRMGVYQIQYMDSVPDSAACNEAVKLARKSGFSTLSGFVNGVLRNIARNSGSIRYPDEEKEPVLALSVRYSMPEWIVEEWLNAYGMEQTKAILDAFKGSTDYDPYQCDQNYAGCVKGTVKSRRRDGADVRRTFLCRTAIYGCISLCICNFRF